jgi:hypothetical protein
LSPYIVIIYYDATMGLIKRFVVSKEPDMKSTVKKIVQVQPPCTAEMAALMECFRVSTQYAEGRTSLGATGGDHRQCALGSAHALPPHLVHAEILVQQG